MLIKVIYLVPTQKFLKNERFITIYLRFTKTVFRLYQLKVNGVANTSKKNLCKENCFSFNIHGSTKYSFDTCSLTKAQKRWVKINIHKPEKY